MLVELKSTRLPCILRKRMYDKVDSESLWVLKRNGVNGKPLDSVISFHSDSKAWDTE